MFYSEHPTKLTIKPHALLDFPISNFPVFAPKKLRVMLRLSAAAALAATPYHSLACEMPLMRLVEACIRARDVLETVQTARSLHASLKCSGLGGSGGLCGTQAIGTILGLASGKVHAQAAEPSATVETKAARRALAQIIDQIIQIIAATEAAESREIGEIGDIAEIATRIARLLDDVLASLKGRWGTLKAHSPIAAFLIDGVEPELARLAKQAPIFEIGVVPVYGADVVTIGASFIVPSPLHFGHGISTMRSVYQSSKK